MTQRKQKRHCLALPGSTNALACTAPENLPCGDSFFFLISRRARARAVTSCDLADCGDNNKKQTMIDFLKEHVPEALVDRIEDEEPSPTDEVAQAKAEL